MILIKQIKEKHKNTEKINEKDKQHVGDCNEKNNNNKKIRNPISINQEKKCWNKLGNINYMILKLIILEREKRYRYRY